MDVMDLRRRLMMMAGVSPGITPFYTGEFEFSTTSASFENAATFQVGAAAYTSDKILFVQIRNKAGKRAGYFYGTDAIIMNVRAQRGQTNAVSPITHIKYWCQNNGSILVQTTADGIIIGTISISGELSVLGRLGGNQSTISGTWEIKAYLLDYIGENPIADIS